MITINRSTSAAYYSVLLQEFNTASIHIVSYTPLASLAAVMSAAARVYSNGMAQCIG